MTENTTVFDNLANLSDKVKKAVAIKEEKNQKLREQLWQVHLADLQKHMDEAVAHGHTCFSLDVERLSQKERTELAAKIQEAGQGTLTVKLVNTSASSSDNARIVVSIN
jgi:hypothetical protein